MWKLPGQSTLTRPAVMTGWNIKDSPPHSS